MAYGDGVDTFNLVDGWIDSTASDRLGDIASIRVDHADRIVVLNRGTPALWIFDRAGNLVHTWEETHDWGRPHGMCLGPAGNVFCTDDRSHTIRKFSPDGELLATLEPEHGPAETGYRDVSDTFEAIASITASGGPFNRPTGVTVTDSGHIFVSDGAGNARIHSFTPDGELVRSWGEPGAAPGMFRLPHTISHDGEDRIWVTDRENSRIQIFERDGQFLAEWIDLIRPTDLAISEDRVFVSELCRRMSVFTRDGELLTRWGNDEHPEDDPLFLAPHTVAVDSVGDLYVGEVALGYANVDRGNRKVQKFERVGK